MLSRIAPAIGVLAVTLSAQAQPAPAAVPTPTATFRPAQQVGGSPASGFDSVPTAGVDRDGRALLVREAYQDDGGPPQILAVSAAPGAPFGAARVVGRGEDPVSAVGAGGRAIIASRTGKGAALLIGSTAGEFARPITLSRTRRPAAVAVAGDGTAAVVLVGDSGSAVQLVTPGGRVLPPRPIDPGAGLITDVNGADPFTQDRLAAGPDGTIALLTGRGVRVRRPGSTRFGRTHPVFTGKVAAPQVAVGPGGRIGVVAIAEPECIFEYGCVGRIVLAQRRSASGRFERMRPRVRRYPKDKGKPVPSANAPRIAYGTSTTPVLAWTEDDDVCTICDMDSTDGPLIAWQPGGRRTTVVRNGFAHLAPAGAGVAVVTAEVTESIRDEPSGRIDVFFAGGGRMARLGRTRLTSRQGLAVAGGRDRLVIAAVEEGLTRAVLAAIRER